jgi:glucose dehydrogenase
MQGSTVDNLTDFSPELRAEAIKLLNQYDYGPIFTPPTEKGTVNLPGWGGGANWWGAAFDPETGVLYIPSSNSPIVVKLTKPNPARSNFQYSRGPGGSAMGPQGLPLFKPPYGRITAIDLNKGEHVWQVPHGDGPRQKVNEILANGKDVGPLGGGGGGPLLTRTLLFVGQGGGGRGGAGGGASNFMRAFDKATGKVIAEIPLAANPHGTPMTYMAGGKQYIVVATYDGRLTALSLP